MSLNDDPAMYTEAQNQAEIERLQEHVWDKIGWQKRLVGKPGVATAVRLALDGWTPPYARLSPNAPTEQARLQEYVRDRMPSQQSRYGFLWALILSAVIGQIVRVLLEWWLLRVDKYELMVRLKSTISLTVTGGRQ